MHRVRIVFQASMKLQNKQDIAVFKGEGEPLLYLSKQTNISHLELPLIIAGAIFLKQMKASLRTKLKS